jgi:hypothetical protein
LLDYFLQSAHLSADKKKEAHAIFEKGIVLEEINLPTNNSWILKKYFLEMAILTIWADKRVEGNEQEFLKRLTVYLSFSEDDLENSMMAVEGFVLEHWDQLNYLQNKQDFNEVSDRFVARMSKVTNTNRTKLLREVQESKGLMELLKKAKSHELTESEKKHMQEMLIVVLKSIPTFVIISLPQRFLTLPILLKILPNNFFAEV